MHPLLLKKRCCCGTYCDGACSAPTPPFVRIEIAGATMPGSHEYFWGGNGSELDSDGRVTFSVSGSANGSVDCVPVNACFGTSDDAPGLDGFSGNITLGAVTAWQHTVAYNPNTGISTYTRTGEVALTVSDAGVVDPPVGVGVNVKYGDRGYDPYVDETSPRNADGLIAVIGSVGGRFTRNLTYPENYVGPRGSAGQTTTRQFFPNLSFFRGATRGPLKCSLPQSIPNRAFFDFPANPASGGNATVTPLPASECELASAYLVSPHTASNCGGGRSGGGVERQAEGDRWVEAGSATEAFWTVERDVAGWIATWTSPVAGPYQVVYRKAGGSTPEGTYQLDAENVTGVCGPGPAPTVEVS